MASSSYFRRFMCKLASSNKNTIQVWDKSRVAACTSKLSTSFDTQKRSLTSSKPYTSNENSSNYFRWSIAASSFLIGCYGMFNLKSMLEKQKKNYVYAATLLDDTKPKGLREQFNFVSNVIKHVSPAVVSIDSTRVLGRHHFHQELQSSGSGFLIDSEGLIITNAHVVANSSKLKIRMSDGQEYQGHVIAADESLDIAAIKINSNTELPYIDLGSVDDLNVGEWVIAVGSPFALQNTFTVGIVSNKCREASELGIRSNYQYIQTDASINIGNSGGPLVNLDGEVIGVNTMRLHSDGISFAIPINLVKTFLQNLKTRAEYSINHRRWVGVTMLTLTPEVAHHFRKRNFFTNRGVFIHQVTPGSPAAKGGMKSSDVVLSINGQKTTSSKQFMDIVSRSDVLDVVVERNGAKISLQIVPEIIEH